jgi:hypothetical protein
MNRMLTVCVHEYKLDCTAAGYGRNGGNEYFAHF